ncbi:MAG TPA: acyl-CoA dehydrogenase family protein [Myxococcota bacterium]|nr:acyl-CoA dehydrogenase family protein [Myxococcota bacterium]
MDLRYSKEYEEYRRKVREFLKSHWPPSGEAAKGSEAEQATRFRALAISHGCVARSIPTTYGGSGQPPDVLKAVIIAEEFGRVHAPGDVRGIGASMLVPTLLEHGREDQKHRFIPPTICGEMHWCQGYSEPGSGSDLASLKTRAELIDGEWVVNGQKIWTSGAQIAQYMFCLCRTEPDAPKHAGISYLLIDMASPGIDVRPLRQMTGTADFNEVFFTNVRVPMDSIVGKRGEGWAVSRSTLKHERNMIGDAAGSRALFEGLLRLARETKRNGKRAIDDPGVRQQLATIEGYVLSHQYSGYRQLTQAARGKDAGIAGMMNKLTSTNIGHSVAKLALDLLGDEGLVAPNNEARVMGLPPRGHAGWIIQNMWSLGVAIAGGSANIQRNVIAERGLGLPRDFAAQRESSR